MARDNSKTADEAQIRQLIDRWAGAIRDTNLEAAVSHYARDLPLYDLAPDSPHAETLASGAANGASSYLS
jgi:ketosteroid isomerase-like protein